MSRLTPREVVRIANLARLSVEPPEAPTLAEAMSTILDHFRVLAAVETDACAQAPDAGPPPRADTPQASALADDVLAAAPRTQARHFLVPKVIE